MGSGFKTFTAGSILTASDVQNYLQDQAVMVFGGTAARSSAIGTANFEEGMLTYLTDVDKLQVYTGASFVDVYPAAATNQGLTLINTTSFSGVASQSVNDVFSATYDNYRIVITYTSAPGAATRLRWRVSGSDNTTTNYNYTGFRSNMADSTTGSWTQTADGNDFHFIGETTTSDISSSVLDVFRPFATAKTNYVFSAIRIGQFYGGAGYFNATTSFTGFTIYSASGTLTGSVSVFGYNK